jgi:exodeoxyribonuclease V alpha subunit
MKYSFDELAAPFIAAGVLTAAEVHCVALVAPRFGESDPARLLGLAFAVRAPRLGHAGVDLARVADSVDDEVRLRVGSSGSRAHAASPEEVLPWPESQAWMDHCAASPMVGRADDPTRPFALQELGDGRLLSTRRMLREQERLAQALLIRARLEAPPSARLAGPDAAIAALFPDDPRGESAKAVRLAEAKLLAVVIGGPGTGKTYSVTRLLAALSSEEREASPLRIELCAPTGKAAVRMHEAIAEALDPSSAGALQVDARVRAKLLALEPKTLHRLLGVRPDGSSRHHASNPIGADLVVVDEVSMVDLVLMRRLLEALGPSTRLVLLGDRDQLASVEAGSVLGDIVGDGSSGPLAPNVQLFTRSRRFASAPDIALVAACLQSYRAASQEVPEGELERIDLAARIATGSAHASAEQHPAARVAWLGAPVRESDSSWAVPSEAQLDRLAAPYLDGFELLGEHGTTHQRSYVQRLLEHVDDEGRFGSELTEPAVQRELLEALGSYRVLCVHRRGPLGVEGLERALAERVQRRLGRRSSRARHWLGRPLLITENAYDLGLMNGDIGLVLPTTSGLAAVFPAGPGEAPRIVALSRLPPHEGALAMTVHKSQGSQFDLVALVLAGRASPIQTRELVYTGVTRAKNRLVWLGGDDELREALECRTQRASGLGAMLRDGVLPSR